MKHRTLRRAALLAAIALTVAMLPDAAHAQMAGGSIDGLVNWGVTSFGRPLLNAAVAVACVMLMLMRASLGMIALVAIGGFGLVNYQTIAGMIGGGI